MQCFKQTVMKQEKRAQSGVEYTQSVRIINSGSFLFQTCVGKRGNPHSPDFFRFET